MSRRGYERGFSKKDQNAHPESSKLPKRRIRTQLLLQSCIALRNSVQELSQKQIARNRGILEKGVDRRNSINKAEQSRTNQGWTPLHSAANWGNYEVIGRLISHGVDVNARSNGSVTALHLAISSQCENAENVFHSVRYLLQAPGIDIGIPSGSGDTPAELARRTSAMLHMLITDHLNR
ncbi:ankyrin repeat protein [Ostertagia ostertagi]